MRMRDVGTVLVAECEGWTICEYLTYNVNYIIVEANKVEKDPESMTKKIYLDIIKLLTIMSENQNDMAINFSSLEKIEMFNHLDFKFLNSLMVNSWNWVRFPTLEDVWNESIN